jgi:hypothetical protein
MFVVTYIHKEQYSEIGFAISATALCHAYTLGPRRRLIYLGARRAFT